MSDALKLKTYVVIPAAGSGQRFDDCLSQPKQYAIVCDKPLICHTINAFLKIKCLDKIIVVSDSENRKSMQEIISSINHQNRIHLVNGSTTRHRSIAQGIEAISANGWPPPDVVIVHDGARPLVDEQLVLQLVTSADKHGASGVICKLTSTVVKITKEHFLDRALDRNKHYSSETPQAFRYELIRDAYEKCSLNDYEFNTECLDLVQRYTKTKIKLIEANASQYFKVTFKKDIYSAEGVLRDKKDVLLHCDFQKESQLIYRFINDLREKLEKNFTNVAFFNNSSAVKLAYNPLIVRILIQFCNSWKDILEKCVSKCDSLVYVVITCDQISNSSHQEINGWAKTKTIDIKKFYAIHSTLDELNKNKDRILKTIMFLSKQCPIELTGQTFFV